VVSDAFGTRSKDHSGEGSCQNLFFEMGLTNAPATFMRMMNDMIRPFLTQFIVVYLDETLIFSKSWDENLQQVNHVLQTL
jgi:hypothetical protein